MAFNARIMRDVDLILGDPATGPNFKCQLRSVTLTPNAQNQSVKTLCRTNGQFSDVDEAEWTLDLGYLYGEDNGVGPTIEILADFLMANHGLEVPYRFRPIAGGKGYAGRCKLVAGPIGGQQGSWSEGSVTLPIVGQPQQLAVPGLTPAAWAATTFYPMEARVTISTSTLEAQNQGTSGASAPTPPATVGDMVVDGTITWKKL